MGDAKRRRELGLLKDPEPVEPAGEGETLTFSHGPLSRVAEGFRKVVQTGPQFDVRRERVTHAELAEMDKESRLNTQWADGLAEVRHKRFLASLARHGKLT